MTEVCDRCCYCYAVTNRVRAPCSPPTVTVSIKDANDDSCAVTCTSLCFIFCQYLQKCHISVIVVRHVFSVNWLLPGVPTFSLYRKHIQIYIHTYIPYNCNYVRCVYVLFCLSAAVVEISLMSRYVAARTHAFPLNFHR